MKWILAFSLIGSMSLTANAKSRFTGKCAQPAAEAVMEIYGHFIDEGGLASVITSQVSKNRSVYKVMVALMDGGGEPFARELTVTFDRNTCENPVVK